MNPPGFTNQVVARPLRRWSGAKDRYSDSRKFVHRVEVRPARFRIVSGVDPEWEHEPVLARINDAPMRRTFYVGRVKETGDGAVLVDLWEIPSGRALSSWIETDGRLEGPEPPAVGDQIAVWTWVELPGKGIVRHRRFAQVRRRELSAADLVKLEEQIESMKEHLSGSGEFL